MPAVAITTLQIFFNGFFGQAGGLKQCICRFIPPVRCQNVYVHHRSDVDELVDFVAGELADHSAVHFLHASLGRLHNPAIVTGAVDVRLERCFQCRASLAHLDFLHSCPDHLAPVWLDAQ